MKRRIPQPKGVDAGHGRTKIAVTMPHELFSTIKALAEKDKKTFSEEVELILKTGLFDLQESDKLEPHAA